MKPKLLDLALFAFGVLFAVLALAYLVGFIGAWIAGKQANSDALPHLLGCIVLSLILFALVDIRRSIRPLHCRD